MTKLEAELTALHQGNISGTVLTSTSQGGHSSAVAMLRESGPEVMEATIELLTTAAEEEAADLDAGYTQLQLRDALLARFIKPIRSYNSRFTLLRS